MESSFMLGEVPHEKKKAHLSHLTHSVFPHLSSQRWDSEPASAGWFILILTCWPRGLAGGNQRECQKTVAWFCSLLENSSPALSELQTHGVGRRNLAPLTVVTFGIRSIFVCTQELAEQLPAGIYLRGDFLSVQEASEFNSAIQGTIYFSNTQSHVHCSREILQV